jgi:hypothetical protein
MACADATVPGTNRARRQVGGAGRDRGSTSRSPSAGTPFEGVVERAYALPLIEEVDTHLAEAMALTS